MKRIFTIALTMAALLGCGDALTDLNNESSEERTSTSGKPAEETKQEDKETAERRGFLLAAAHFAVDETIRNAGISVTEKGRQILIDNAMIRLINAASKKKDSRDLSLYSSSSDAYRDLVKIDSEESRAPLSGSSAPKTPTTNSTHPQSPDWPSSPGKEQAHPDPKKPEQPDFNPEEPRKVDCRLASCIKFPSNPGPNQCSAPPQRPINPLPTPAGCNLEPIIRCALI